MENLPQSIQTLSGKWISSHIFNLELNRPDQLNAMNPQFFLDLQQSMQFLDLQPDLRVIILTANGKHFTTGLDLNEAQSLMSPEGDDVARKAIKTYNVVKKLQDSISSVSKCRVPVIVGIHNACIGGGVDLSAACDIRYCTKDARFSIKEVDIGICADLGTVQRLPLLTGNDSLFRELNYTGRFFDSKEALQLGMVSKICENKETMLEEIIKLANIIANKSPVAIWTIKQVLNHDMNRQVDQNLDYMARVNAGMLMTDDIQESVTSFLMKKQAAFPKL